MMYDDCVFSKYLLKEYYYIVSRELEKYIFTRAGSLLHRIHEIV